MNGQAEYTFDTAVPGLLHLKLLRSPHAHARILAIKTSAARALPGVVAVRIKTRRPSGSRETAVLAGQRGVRLHTHLAETADEAAFLLQRGVNGIAAVSHRDALRWATEGSAACLGRPELGRIAVGAAADLALFRLDELRFSGAGDPVAALVLCGAHRADRVMVAGRWVVEHGTISGLDLAELMRRHNGAAAVLAAASATGG